MKNIEKAIGASEIEKINEFSKKLIDQAKQKFNDKGELKMIDNFKQNIKNLFLIIEKLSAEENYFSDNDFEENPLALAFQALTELLDLGLHYFVMRKNMYKSLLLLTCLIAIVVLASAQQTSSIKKILKEEYNLTPQHSKDTQYYDMISRLQPHTLDGTPQGWDV